MYTDFNNFLTPGILRTICCHHNYVSFQAKMYENLFRTPLGKLTALPQIPQSAGEGDASPFPYRKGARQRGGPRAPNAVKALNSAIKAIIHCPSFPITSPQQVGNFPIYGEATGNVCNGFWAKRLKTQLYVVMTM